MFKDRLEEALAMRNMTAAELSRKSGVTEGMISTYRKGLYMPKSDKIYALANALNVSPAWLVGYEEPTSEALEEEVKIIFNSLPTHLQEQALMYLHFLARSDTPTNPEGSDESL